MPKAAIIVVDMLRDSVYNGEEFTKIILPLQHFLSSARKLSIPIIYANDSFLPNDFIFRGRFPPRSIRGTEGAKVITELEPELGDMILEKRRFSAFFKTDLDMTLRLLKVDIVAVTGISTDVCVLMTALDAVAYDFNAVIVEDCCASFKRSTHESIISAYRRGGLYPMLQIMTSEEFLSSQQAQGR